MEKNNEKGKNIIIGVLLVIIVCLSIALVFVCYNKFLSKDNKDSEASEITNNDESLEKENIYSKYVGRYEYEKNNDSLNDKEKGGPYYVLEIKSDGSATYEWGNTHGSIDKATGSISISNDKLYFNGNSCNNQSEDCEVKIEFEISDSQLLVDGLKLSKINDVALDEEDVKKWLKSNSGIIESYFVNKQNDFDYSIATEKDYSEFLFWRILGDSKTIETKDIHESSNYSLQYTYKLDYIKNILNSYFGVGIDKINIDIMNSYLKDYANFSIEGDKFIVKFNSFDGDTDICSKLNKIYVKDNQIVVNYDIVQRISYDECGEKRDYGRELVLKKTSNGYNLLKAYKVD